MSLALDVVWLVTKRECAASMRVRYQLTVTAMLVVNTLTQI